MQESEPEITKGKKGSWYSYLERFVLRDSVAKSNSDQGLGQQKQVLGLRQTSAVAPTTDQVTQHLKYQCNSTHQISNLGRPQRESRAAPYEQ